MDDGWESLHVTMLYNSITFVLNNGSCTTRARLGGADWCGPRQGDLNPGKCRAWHQFVFKASTHLLSALSGVYGPFPLSGYYAFTFSVLSEPLGKGLERYSS